MLAGRAALTNKARTKQRVAQMVRYLLERNLKSSSLRAKMVSFHHKVICLKQFLLVQMRRTQNFKKMIVNLWSHHFKQGLAQFLVVNIPWNLGNKEKDKFRHQVLMRYNDLKVRNALIDLYCEERNQIYLEFTRKARHFIQERQQQEAADQEHFTIIDNAELRRRYRNQNLILIQPKRFLRPDFKKLVLMIREAVLRIHLDRPAFAKDVVFKEIDHSELNQIDI